MMGKFSTLKSTARSNQGSWMGIIQYILRASLRLVGWAYDTLAAGQNEGSNTVWDNTVGTRTFIVSKKKDHTYLSFRLETPRLRVARPA